MARDPIVEEVRRIRQKIEAECETQGKSYYEHLIEAQKSNQDRLVSLLPNQKGKTRKERKGEEGK